LTAVARQKESRRALLLLGRILRTPGLAESMWHALTNEKPRTEMSSLQQTKTQKAEKKRGK
jgi:hypothetical protein